MKLFWVYVLLAFLPGCLPFFAISQIYTGPLGSVSNGFLFDAVYLGNSKNLKFYHNRQRQYGTVELVSMLKSVSSELSLKFDDNIIMLGDMSGKHGGHISGHASHRAGMDVDVAFFVRDLKKGSDTFDRLNRYDRFGVTLDDSGVKMFDYEKNWAFVEACLKNTDWEVQWIFVSKGLKAAMLRWALANGRDLEVIYKAAHILHQPSDSSPHNDHFHVRVYCPGVSLDNRGQGCRQRRPVWEWVEQKFLQRGNCKFNDCNSVLSDDDIMKMALDGL